MRWRIVIYKLIETLWGFDAIKVILIIIGVVFLLYLVGVIIGSIIDSPKKEQEKEKDTAPIPAPIPATRNPETVALINRLRDKAPSERTQEEAFKLYIDDITEGFSETNYFKNTDLYGYFVIDRVSLYYRENTSSIKLVINTGKNKEILSHIHEMISEKNIYCRDKNYTLEMVLCSPKEYNDVSFMRELIKKIGECTCTTQETPCSSGQDDNIPQSLNSNDTQIVG